MRVSLGGASLLRLDAFAAMVLIASCTGSARSGANDPEPLAPLAAPDAITRLALDSALAKCPGADQPSVLIVARGGLNTQGLVKTGQTQLVWLSPDELQPYADDHGDVSYLEVYPAVMRGDSAIVSISRSRAFQRRNHEGPVVRDGSMVCDWIAVRRKGAWAVVALGNVLVLD
jgi:hypothetical protein